MNKELLHFTADWCNPCKKLKPIIEEYVLDNPDMKYTQVDVDKEIQLTKDYGILSVPTLISMIDGKIVSRHSGIANKKEIESLFN